MRLACWLVAAVTIGFTTAWSLAVAGGLSKNGAAPGGVLTGSNGSGGAGSVNNATNATAGTGGMVGFYYT